jgi:succinoglycan biosynthesis protein ExoH
VTDIVIVTANVSSRINLMRLVLISGIVFVHIPFNTDSTPFQGTYGFFDWLRVFLRDSLFRIGVPCLSAISGYLLFRDGGETFDYGKTIRRKAKTILLPFLLWNSAFFLLVLILQNRGIGDGYLPDIASAGPHTLATLLLAVDGTPIDLPLYFLRDLFVCILLSPLLAALLRRHPVPVLAALLLLAALPISVGIVLRNSILFSFAFGMFLSLHRVDLRMLDRFAAPVAAAFMALAVLLATVIYATGPHLPTSVEISRNLMVLAGIPGFWALSAILIRSRLFRRFSEGSGLSFWIFCAHYPLLFCLWVLWNRSGSHSYPIFYIFAAAITFTVLPFTNGMARSALPSLYNLLTGSRTRRPGAALPGENARPVSSERR